jgi:hypothetical protein
MTENKCDYYIAAGANPFLEPCSKCIFGGPSQWQPIPDHRDEEIMKLGRQRDNLLEFIKRAPVSSGVCCCGDSMEKHSSVDHTPVDMWDHAVLSFVEEMKDK